MTDHLSRREFAESLAAAALLPLPLPLRRSPAAPAVVSPELAAPAATDISATARALLDAVRAQYAGRLTPAELETIGRSIEGNLKRAASIRRVPLVNGAEPDFVFAAHLSASS